MPDPMKLQFGIHPSQHVLQITTDISTNPSPPTLVYVHGGAWRDPDNTASEVIPLCKLLDHRISVFSAEYRLSPEVKHPEHLNDVMNGIDFLIKKRELKNISLVGHSVGATIILQLLNEWKRQKRNIAELVKSVYLLEGIYDLKELLVEYPDYAGFVNEAHEDYTKVERIDFRVLKDVQVHVVQSYQDELLSLHQTDWICENLRKEQIEYHLFVAHLGTHNDVYESEKLADYINTTFI